MTEYPDELAPVVLADRIRALGFPEVMVTIATQGGAVVHPALRGHADAIGAPGRAVMRHHRDLVPLWSSGTMVTLAAPDATVSRWSAELPGEPLREYADLAAAVRELLTDMWELDEDDTGDQDRRSIARMLLRPDQVSAALVPIER